LKAARLSNLMGSHALLRMSEPLTGDLWQPLFARYPHEEGVRLALFGWRVTPGGIVVMLRDLVRPEQTDIDLSEPTP